MSKIMQGDKYALPISIRQGDVAITNANADGLRIHVGDLEHRFPDGELIYSSSDSAWMFPLTQEETLNMGGSESVQAEIIVGENIFRSDVSRVDVGRSIIMTPWEVADGEN